MQGMYMENPNGKHLDHRVIDFATIVDAENLLLSGDGGESRCYYENKLTSREMDSVVAFCDTFLPSYDAVAAQDVEVDAVRALYHTSASMAGTPERLGGLLSNRLKHPKLILLRVTLLMLSTCIGTFILCGRASLSCRFPYFLKFSKLPLHKREKIFLSWSLSFFPLIKMFLRVMKLLTLLVFFSQISKRQFNSIILLFSRRIHRRRQPSPPPPPPPTLPSAISKPTDQSFDFKILSKPTGFELTDFETHSFRNAHNDQR